MHTGFQRLNQDLITTLTRHPKLLLPSPKSFLLEQVLGSTDRHVTFSIAMCTLIPTQKSMQHFRQISPVVSQEAAAIVCAL